MLTCIYCQNEKFERGKGSEEHVIISSLGGRKVSKNICCQTCNNLLGDEIDADLSKNLSFFSTMMNITTGRNKSAPVHRKAVSYAGKDYDIGPGGSFKLSKADVKISDTDDPKTKAISITAGNEQQALGLLEQVLRKFGKSIEEFQSMDAKSIKSYIPSVHHRFSLCGEKQLRSITKMMLTYAATVISPERLRSGCFSPVIEFIKGNNPSYDGIQFDTITPFPEQPTLNEVNHRVFFVTSERLKLAIGLIEIFGKLRFSAVLSQEWNGPSLGKAYAIDPVSKRQENIDFSYSEEIFSFPKDHCLDMEAYENAIGQLIQVFQKRQVDEKINKIINNAIERHMVGKGKFATKEMIKRVSKEVALEFMQFTHRLKTVKDIDLRKRNIIK